MERSCDYIRTFTQHYRRSERRETGNCSITAAPIGGKVDFPVFLRSERRKAGNYSFTAALVGGKPDFPVFLLSKGRKTRNSSFTASPIGGKVDFPVFLRSERRKTGNCIYAAGTYGGSLSVRFLILFLLPSFACWWFMGWGLVPQNEGRTCVNNNWVK